MGLLLLGTASGWAQDPMHGAAGITIERKHNKIARADAMYNKARELSQAGEFEEASEELKSAIALLPNAPVVRPRRDQYFESWQRANAQVVQNAWTDGRWWLALKRGWEGVLASTYAAPATVASPVPSTRLLLRPTALAIPGHFVLIFFLAMILGGVAGMRARPQSRNGWRFFAGPLLVTAGIVVWMALFGRVGAVRDYLVPGELNRMAVLYTAIFIAITSVPFLVGKIAGFQLSRASRRARDARADAAPGALARPATPDTLPSSHP